MKLVVTVAVALMISSTAAYDFETMRDNFIEYHVNFNCLASIGFFTTHFYTLYRDNLLSSLTPQIKEWGINFLLHSVAGYWNKIYDDIQDLYELSQDLMQQIEARGFNGTMSYIATQFITKVKFKTANIVELMEERWTKMYPGEFDYYVDLFKKSCPFSYLYSKIQYF